jgi:GntR family transcriptional regulator of gluconate operon
MTDLGLRPIDPPRSLAEDAADRIREEILAGGFAQGEHLVEAKIAERLNVSRGPVREAFKLLRSEGLLQEEPRRGTFVVRLMPADIREIYGLRAAIEGRAARDIAEGADLEFHDALCRLSGNARLHEVFSRYVPTLRALLRLDEHVYRSLDEIAMEHRPLLEAIESGDAERAAELAAHHCDHAGELIADLIESRPER